MKSSPLDLLIQLAKRKRVTTGSLAKSLGQSQQTISRRLKELEAQGLIERLILPRGQLVTLTPEGRRFLRRKYLELREVVEIPETKGISFGGELISGSGEGRYYVRQEEYFVQFHEKLGFRPFLGTLNLRLKSVSDLTAREEMERLKPILVEGFEKEGRTFGGIRCYPCVVNRRCRGAVIIPERTHHPPDVVEVISPKNLRRELSLRDGDYVHVEVRR